LISILSSEWYKLRKTKIMSIVFVGPLVGLFIGLIAGNMFTDLEINEWYITMFSMNFTYALLFLPLITGILASIICRYEHQEGGWKQLLAMPVTREKVYLSKYILLVLVVFVIQLLYLAAIFIVGNLKGYTDPFPVAIVWKSIIGGWIATFPLIALQLWLSVMWKSFAAPFALNVVFTVPTILAINSEKIAPFYPWAQPFSMMHIGGKQGDIFFVPLSQLAGVVGGGFLLFLCIGLLYFRRKAV